MTCDYHPVSSDSSYQVPMRRTYRRRTRRPPAWNHRALSVPIGSDHRDLVSDVKTGTIVRVLSPDLASSILDDDEALFYKTAGGAGWLSPHLTLTFDGLDERRLWNA